MCTAVAFRSGSLYFGRNLDLERGYGEGVVITPRNFPLRFRNGEYLKRHYAMVGMAAVAQGYPLYFEATNEKGLSAAALNFPGNAVYHPAREGMRNIAPFEIIPWILGQCENLREAAGLLRELNVLDTPFSEELPLSPLHWMLTGAEGSLVLESRAEGLTVVENPFEVLTNNPPFFYHATRLSDFMHLHPGAAQSRFRDALPLENYSFGLGAMGLPGDYSSASRFVRAFFVKENVTKAQEEGEAVNQFFRILEAVAMPKGCVAVPGGFEYTRYSSCCNTDRGIYYYTTYSTRAFRKVEMGKENLEENKLLRFEALGL